MSCRSIEVSHLWTSRGELNNNRSIVFSGSFEAGINWRRWNTVDSRNGIAWKRVGIKWTCRFSARHIFLLKNARCVNPTTAELWWSDKTSPFSLAWFNKSCIACPERTPGCTLSGRLGKLLRAHSSSQGRSSSSAIPSRTTVRDTLEVWMGLVKASAPTMVARIAKQNFMVSKTTMLSLKSSN